MSDRIGHDALRQENGLPSLLAHLEAVQVR